MAAPARPFENAIDTPAVAARVRIGFLFNHDHLHQIAHSAPIAFEMSRLASEIDVILFASCPVQLDYLRQLSRTYHGIRCEFVLLTPPAAVRVLARALNPLMPFLRLATLFANRALFAALDVLVVPEKTSLLLRSRLGLKDVKLVYTHHGAGDRAVGFGRDSSQFDLVLVSGGKVRDRLLAAGGLREHGHAIVGYPKFDMLKNSAVPARLFDNALPTVLYNPHFSPRLSSWYRIGPQILDYFYESKKYNLIFAPHVMLFRKKMQVSLERLRIDWPGTVAERYRDCPHMLIDTGSARSVDMTYTRVADLYLGDASSQVYEFLIDPRPCLFINAQKTVWRDDANYTHWNSGPVMSQIDELDARLTEAFATHRNYRDRQQTMFQHTFDLNEQASSLRGAKAILNLISRDR